MRFAAVVAVISPEGNTSAGLFRNRQTYVSPNLYMMNTAMLDMRLLWIKARHNAIRLTALCGLIAPLLFAGSESSVVRGRRLFSGREAVTGVIVGHKTAMPAAAVRCGNCHQAGDSGPRQSLGPRLNRDTLLEIQKRRGAPPSAYDMRTFCRILRTGVDPAYVVIAPEMPRYEIDDGQCQSLWLYLTGEEGKRK
jgi:hypothetical protein